MTTTFNSNIDLSLLPLKDQYKLEMANIKKWLIDNDYKVNKHLLGEYADNDSCWQDYLTSRKVKLDRYNLLEQKIVEINNNEI